jgi:hypothetical protein
MKGKRSQVLRFAQNDRGETFSTVPKAGIQPDTNTQIVYRIVYSSQLV